MKARRDWENVPLQQKVDMFVKAGDLAATKYRYKLMASTMLGQGKTAFQAEIDAAAELADFLRFFFSIAVFREFFWFFILGFFSN